MRWPRLAAPAVALATLLDAGAVVAQPPGTSTQPAEQHWTLDSLLVSLQRAADVVQLRTAGPRAQAVLDSLAADFRSRPGLGELTIDALAAVVTGRKAGLAHVARWSDVLPTRQLHAGFEEGLQLLMQVGNTSIDRRLRGQGVPNEEIRRMLAPLTALQRAGLLEAQAWNEEKLRRFELKYGPDSPALNGIEVLLNYGAQWIRPLAPRADGSPNPMEIVAAYRTLEIALNEQADTARMVAAAQFGMRRYFWNPEWGTGNRIQRLLRPRHASAGVVLLGPSEKPFVRAWGPDHRRGVFVGWGDLHAAYVFERPRRILVGTGKQLVPYVF